MAVDPQRSPLIGRASELADILSALGLSPGSGTGAADLAGDAVVLGGDAGVGKTRVLKAVRDAARTAGWREVVGHCLYFGDSAPPYLPVTEVLGRLAAESPDLTSAVLQDHPALARLLPGQRVRGSGTGPAASGSGDVTSTGRAETVEAVRALLQALAVERPLLLVVEDAHWADQATRELLTYLLSLRSEGRVAIVVSFRSDDVHRRHPLRAALAQWTRLPGVRRVQLEGLDDASVRTLAASVRPAGSPGAPSGPADAEKRLRAIVDRADGNPFFAEELASAASVDAVPDDLADLLLVRLDRLSPAARDAVRAASVAGRLVSHAALAAVTAAVSGAPVDAPALDVSLREAVEQHVLVSTRGSSYAFRHALLAEATYDDLLPGERVRLHAAYVRVLASGMVAGTAAELARHARAAQDLPTAARAAAEAGAEAMRVGAPEDAARLYQTALELTANPGPVRDALDLGPGDAWNAGPDDHPSPFVLLALRTATALSQAGEPGRALDLLLHHLGPTDGPSLDRARLLVGIATQLSLTDSDLDPAPLTAEAMRLVPDHASPLRARTLSVHALGTTRLVDREEGRRLGAAALEMARAVGLPMVAAEAAVTLARAEDLGGDLESANERLQTVLEDARDDDDVPTQLRALHQQGTLAYAVGDLARARERFLVAARLASGRGRPWAPYGLDSRALGALTAYAQGDWDLATSEVDTRGETPPMVAASLLGSIRLAILAGRGQPDPLLLSQTRAAWGRDGMVAAVGGGAGIDLLGDAHDLQAMVAAHDEAVALVTALYPGSTPWVQIRFTALVLGQLATHVGRTPTAQRVDLIAVGERVLEAGAAVWTTEDVALPTRLEARAWRDRSLAEHQRLRWLTGVDGPDEHELVDGWRQSVSTFTALGHVYEAARSGARLAAALKAVGEPAEARRLGAASREVATRLDAKPLLLELRGLGGATRREAPDGGTGRPPLTEREAEVLALVAQGHSNGEIGRQLFISTKTVSVHVSNLMAKLGASGRTEAAAVARRAGLLPD